MKIASGNVNGIRAVFKKGLENWIKSSNFPDVLCLQETKAHLDQYPEELRQIFPYTIEGVWADKKGYSGVAILSKIKPLQIIKGIDDPLYDSEGRFITFEFENFYLVNGYYPNGSRDHSRVNFKLACSQKALEFAQKLEKKKPVLLCGDFNTAHFAIDLANPKSNEKTTGFLPHEREWLDHLTGQGYTDVHRAFHPQKAGEYTWWTYRSNCRERNIGWRIDYFFASKKCLPLIATSQILSHIQGSDHCPIEVNLP